MPETEAVTLRGESWGKHGILNAVGVEVLLLSLGI
jgi:hypothetical protein